ncbi:MAG: oligosaccharide flippase family protein [Parvicellaceae bacterium]
MRILEKLKKVRNAIYYLLGEGISKLIVLFSISFFTNYFDKASFGKLSLFWISIPILSVFIDFSQRSYIKSVYINSKEKINEVIQSVRLFSLGLFSFLFLIFGILNYLDVVLIDKGLDSLILFCSFFFVLIEISLSYFQIRGDAIHYNIIFILRQALPYVLTVLYLIFFSGGIISFGIIHLVVVVPLAVYLVFRRHFITLSWELFYETIKSSLSFSIPFIPAMISVLLLGFSDRFLIKYYFSDVEVANYTIAYTVGTIYAAFFLATNKMWQKYILEGLKLQKIDEIKSAAKKYLLLVVLVGVIIVLLKTFLVNILSNSSYFVILDIIPTILLGMFFYFLYTVMSNIPFFHKNTYLMALPAFIAAGLNIVLNVIMLPIYGYKIAALTTLISYFIEFLVIYIICLKKYKINLLI